VVVSFVILSLCVHEVAHAWVALLRGDTTARDLGRITLNPIAHVDPIMTVLVPVLMYLQFGFLFGGAKPVPVNFYNLRNGHRDMALVALAGPLSNFLIAVLFLLGYRVMVDETGYWDPGLQGAGILLHVFFWNLVLAVFNLMPIPPLDGSRVVTWLLPQSLRPAYISLERLGILLVIFVMWFVQPVRALFWDTMGWLAEASYFLVTLGGLW